MLEFHKGKEYHPVPTQWKSTAATHSNVKKKQHKKNTTCLRTAPVVSLKYPEDSAFQFILKQHSYNRLCGSENVTTASMDTAASSK